MDKTMASYMKLNSAKCDAWILYLNFELYINLVRIKLVRLEILTAQDQ